MERLYNYWLWRIAQELPISKKEFSALTRTAKVAFIRQFPPLLHPFYKQHSRKAMYRAAWRAGVGRISKLRKAQLAEIATYLNLSRTRDLTTTPIPLVTSGMTPAIISGSHTAGEATMQGMEVIAPSITHVAAYLQECL